MMKNFVSRTTICLITVFVIGIVGFILKNTIFFSTGILGNLTFSYENEHVFRLHIDSETVGYITYEDGYIKDRYAYGTLGRGINENGFTTGFMYFLYDCLNNQVRYFDAGSEDEFKTLLSRYNLPWKNFRMRDEVEDWLAVKNHERKFSNVCPAKP